MKKRSRPDKYASTTRIIEALAKISTKICEERERTTDEAISERLKNAYTHLMRTYTEIHFCYPDAESHPALAQ